MSSNRAPSSREGSRWPVSWPSWWPRAWRLDKHRRARDEAGCPRADGRVPGGRRQGTIEWPGESTDVPDAAVQTRGRHGCPAVRARAGHREVRAAGMGGSRASTTSRTRELRRARRIRIERPSHADFSLLHFDPDLDPEAVAVMLAARDDVEYAQAAYKVRSYFRPNDPLYDQQWNLSLIGWRMRGTSTRAAASRSSWPCSTRVSPPERQLRVHRRIIHQRGLHVPRAGSDRRAFAAAPDLTSSGRFVSPYDFIYDDPNPVDMDGHGTHVSAPRASSPTTASARPASLQGPHHAGEVHLHDVGRHLQLALRRH